MRIRIQGSILDGVEIDRVDNVVICDDLGQPLLVAVNAGTSVWSESAESPNFNQVIKDLGLNTREMVTVQASDLKR